MPEEFKLPKFCVFCGEKPSKKTKEHIIPKWLIKLTGKPDREINLGIDSQHFRKTKELKSRKFSFQSFQFPACDKCNGEYSDFENEIKYIVDKILGKDFLSNIEINKLLDWLDKIRIGLWLGTLLLDREFAPVDPSFHIKNRISSKDRGVFVYEMKDDWNGVQFQGTNSPIFLFSPSCFSLCINNFYFFNFSSEFILSENLGFPYCVNAEYQNDDKRIITSHTKGKEFINKSIIKNKFRIPSIEIYQPIFSKKLTEVSKNDNLHDTEYVKNNSLDFQEGIGKIFYRDEGKVIPLEDDIELCLSDESFLYKREKYGNKVLKQVLDFQTDFINKMPSSRNLKPEYQENMEKQKKEIIKTQKLFKSIIN